MDKPVTVTELNRYIKTMFSFDQNLCSITVKGEVSNFKDHKKSGHFYFTLKDANCSIHAVMFRSNAQKVKFTVENGMKVVASGNVAVFERDGVYQLYCQTLNPDGIGALYLAFEQLKEKLFKLGLFDEAHKKSLPCLPKKIGVVTSSTGAALQDILNILKRRYPIADVIIFPSLVQGENAPDSIVSAIKLASKRKDIDVLIVGRGGGSIEDLWAFNDEKTAYAVYNCEIPVISAVGHEVDFTICDFVADLRAPTPSAAAELCAPDIRSLYSELDMASAALDIGITAVLNKGFDKLKTAYTKFQSISPETKLNRFFDDLAAKSVRMNIAIDGILQSNTDRMLKAASSLEALSPLKVLTRGYSITYSDKVPLTSIKELKSSDIITTVLSDGQIKSTVVNISKKRRDYYYDKEIRTS